MAKKNGRDDPPKPQVAENEQMSDIILILDKMELILQAVSQIDKDGRYKTVPADKEHTNSFLKIDRYASMFENFLKNFWSQLKDPTRFGILSVKEKALDDPKVRQAIEDLAAGKKTDAVEEFLVEDDTRAVQMLVVHTHRQNKMPEYIFGNIPPPRHFTGSPPGSTHIHQMKLSGIIRNIGQRHIGIKKLQRLTFVNRQIRVEYREKAALRHQSLLLQKILLHPAAVGSIRHKMRLTASCQEKYQPQNAEK